MTQRRPVERFAHRGLAREHAPVLFKVGFSAEV